MIAVFMIVAVLGFLVVRAQLAANRTSPSLLDLSSVRDAMIEKHKWTAERADAAESEYIRFLTLLRMKPRFMLVPWNDSEGRDDLDQFWHQHILDTVKYAADCKAVFGRMIHHNPHVLHGSQQEQDAVDKTRRLYARTFKAGPFGAEAKSEDTWSCSACATVAEGSADSHSGHHDGSGGHDGGHSGGSDGGSGGHSCGGHGCGHGCGGGCGGH